MNTPVSAKRGNGNIGFGILSIKNIAAKYGGEVILNFNDGVFETHLLLNNRWDEIGVIPQNIPSRKRARVGSSSIHTQPKSNRFSFDT